ncbi:hypothetical protein DFJ73DRAFT_931649 [Zopfochytrium polystomum]|nr:hypothetical protein DFJ73DRAFT_931649 [Zopfochytrium polystomum]
MTSTDKANFEAGRGLHAADKSATYTPEDHQMGDLATQFVSTTKAPRVARVYNEEEGHGILKIDTAKVPAFKKNSIDMHKYMKKRHQKNSLHEKAARIEEEVLIKHEIPQEACSLFLERRGGGGGGESSGELFLYRRGRGSRSCAGGKGGKPGAPRAPQSAPGAAKAAAMGKASTVLTAAAAKPPKASPKRAKRLLLVEQKLQTLHGVFYYILVRAWAHSHDTQRFVEKGGGIPAMIKHSNCKSAFVCFGIIGPYRDEVTFSRSVQLYATKKCDLIVNHGIFNTLEQQDITLVEESNKPIT